MRLTPDQVQAIRQVAQHELGEDARVRVFGSQVLDDRLGGDIDLLFETDKSQQNRASTICRLYGALVMQLGDRKIDVLLKDPNTPDVPIFQIAKRTGVLL